MKILKFTLGALILTFMVSCSNSLSEDNSRTEEDAILKSEIEGQWEKDLGYIKKIRTFYADGIFSDSTIQLKSRTIQTSEGEKTLTYDACDEEYANNQYLEKVVTGTYDIENGVLSTKATSLLFACNPIEGNDAIAPYFDASIEIENQTLTTKQARLFSRTNSGSGIEGTWETKYSAYIQSTDLETGAEVVEMTERVVFSDNSDTFQQILMGSPTGELSYEMEYVYNGSELSANDGSDSWSVDIKGDKMTWLYNLHTEAWAKVQ